MAREAELLVDGCEHAEQDEIEVVAPEILIGDGEIRGNLKRRFVPKKFLDNTKPKEKQLH
jgi:hypothetical protein